MTDRLGSLPVVGADRGINDRPVARLLVVFMAALPASVGMLWVDC